MPATDSAAGAAEGQRVDLADVQWLAGRSGRAVLAGLPPYRPDQAMTVSAGLRADGLDPARAAAALTQARLRATVAQRLSRPGAVPGAHSVDVDELLLTPDGAEQATRPVVAALRAQRYAALGDGAPVADLGCGIGLDTMALAGAGLAVEAFEADPVTAAVAEVNVGRRTWRHRPAVTCADVQQLPEDQWTRYAGAFADPARRSGGRRVLDPQQWSPPLPWVMGLPVANLGVKVAPGIDHDWAGPGTELAVVSVAGEVVEAALYRGELRQPGVSRSATVVTSSVTCVTDLELPDDPPVIAPVGRFLHEPDGAVIRAGLVTAIAERLDAWLLDPRIAYLSSDRPPATTSLQSSYEVTAVMPFSLKALRAHLRAAGVGHVVVKKRGSAVDVDRLRQSLRLDAKATGSRVVLLTRIGTAPIAVVTVPAGPVAGG